MKDLLLITLFTSFSIFSQSNGLVLDTPDVSGSGCPLGTSSISLSPDQKSISILFDNYSVEVPYENDLGQLKTIDYKVCNIKLPINIPEGHKVESVSFDYDVRGYSFADPGLQIKFSSLLVSATGLLRSDIANDRPRMKKLHQNTWLDRDWGVDEDWVLSNVVEQVINSNCAQIRDRSFKLILKNVLSASMSKRLIDEGFTAMATLDSTDIKSKMDISIKLKKCTDADIDKRKRRDRRGRSKRRTRN